MMSNQPKVFVSRKLADDSPIRGVCTSKATLTCQSLIDISCMPLEEDLNNYTWIFFYSRNGVRCFASQYPTVRNNIKFAALGPGTAAELRLQNYIVDYIGNGVAADIALRFPSILKDTDNTLFIRANKSKDSLYNMLCSSHSCVSIPIYKNTMRSSQDIEEHDILIFTSPMNAQAYAKYHDVTDTSCIAIGDPTREALVDLGAKIVYKSATATEDGIAHVLSDVL